MARRRGAGAGEGVCGAGGMKQGHGGGRGSPILGGIHSETGSCSVCSGKCSVPSLTSTLFQPG